MPYFMLKDEYKDVYAIGGLVGLVLLIFACVIIGIDTNKFDKNFDNGLITIPANEFVLGQNGNPLASEVATGTIPYGYGLETHPRQIDITGCQKFEFGGEKLYAAAPSIADQISISMPVDNRGQVEVCAPKDLEDVPVYLWIK